MALYVKMQAVQRVAWRKVLTLGIGQYQAFARAQSYLMPFQNAASAINAGLLSFG